MIHNNKRSFGARISDWLDEPDGEQFTDGKWRFWLPAGVRLQRPKRRSHRNDLQRDGQRELPDARAPGGLGDRRLDRDRLPALFRLQARANGKGRVGARLRYPALRHRAFLLFGLHPRP